MCRDAGRSDRPGEPVTFLDLVLVFVGSALAVLVGAALVVTVVSGLDYVRQAVALSRSVGPPRPGAAG